MEGLPSGEGFSSRNGMKTGADLMTESAASVGFVCSVSRTAMKSVT